MKFKNSLDDKILDPEIFHLNPRKSDTDWFKNIIRYCMYCRKNSLGLCCFRTYYLNNVYLSFELSLNDGDILKKREPQFKSCHLTIIGRALSIILKVITALLSYSQFLLVNLLYLKITITVCKYRSGAINCWKYFTEHAHRENDWELVIFVEYVVYFTLNCTF